MFPAMSAEHLYLIGDSEILKVGTRFSLTYAAAIAGIVSAFVSAILVDFINPVALGVLLALLLVLMLSEYRARRLERLSKLPRDELVSRRGAEAIPWSSVQYMTVKERTLTIMLPDRWASGTLAEADVVPLSQRAIYLLGSRFAMIQGPTRTRSPLNRLLLLALLLFIIEQAITIGFALTPLSSADLQRYATLYGSVKQTIGTSFFTQWAAIYVNNVQVALTNFVPGYGFFALGGASYNTGRIIQAAAQYYNVTPAVFLFNLYLSPHSIVEEACYPLATAFGICSLWRKQSYEEFSNWKTRGSTKALLGFGSVAVILAIAATLEVTEPRIGLWGLFLWGPVLLGGAYIYVKFGARLAKAVS